MNTTKELADIGSKAAIEEMKKREDFSTYLFLSPGYCKKHYNSDRPAREAFAAAVAEKVRREQQTAIDCLQQTITDLRTELAKRDELIKRYKPRPVSVQPTKTDADHHGRVLLIGPGGVSTQALHTDWRVHSSWTYWLPCSVDAYGLAPSPEEVERREWEQMIASCVPGGQSCDPQVVADNLRAWQAARAAKEGKV